MVLLCWCHQKAKQKIQDPSSRTLDHWTIQHVAWALPGSGDQLVLMCHQLPASWSCLVAVAHLVRGRLLSDWKFGRLNQRCIFGFAARVSTEISTGVSVLEIKTFQYGNTTKPCWSILHVFFVCFFYSAIFPKEIVPCPRFSFSFFSFFCLCSAVFSFLYHKEMDVN